MAGPPDHRAIPGSTWRPHDPANGGAPRAGDFAKLLEAARAPRAHRMQVDPELEAWGSTRARGRGRAPYGPPGMVRDTAPARRPSPAAEPASAQSRDDAAFGAGAPAPVRRAARAWSERPLRDRVVMVLFGLAAVSILLNVLEAASRSGGADLGVLLVLGVVAFLVLRSRLRARRRDRADTR